MGRKSVAAFLVFALVFLYRPPKNWLMGLKRKNDSSDFLESMTHTKFPEDKFNPSIMSLVCRKRKPENEPSKTAKKTTTRKKKQLSQDECRVMKIHRQQEREKKARDKMVRSCYFPGRWMMTDGCFDVKMPSPPTADDISNAIARDVKNIPMKFIQYDNAIGGHTLPNVLGHFLVRFSPLPPELCQLIEEYDPRLLVFDFESRVHAR